MKLDQAEREEEKQCTSWNFSARAVSLAENGVLEIIVEVFDEMVHGSPFLVHPQDSRSVSVFRC